MNLTRLPGIFVLLCCSGYLGALLYDVRDPSLPLMTAALGFTIGFVLSALLFLPPSDEETPS